MAAILMAEVVATLATLHSTNPELCQSPTAVGSCSPEDEAHKIERELQQLRRLLLTSDEELWYSLHPHYYLNPFLRILKSDCLPSRVTCAALNALYTMLDMQLINLTSDHAAAGLRSIVETVSLCQFDTADPVAQDSVLLRILHIMEACFKDSLRFFLTDSQVLNIIKTCFRIVKYSSAERILLKEVAFQTITVIFNSVFGRLPSLPVISSPTSDQEGNAKQENKLESSCGIEKEDVQNSTESCDTSSNEGETILQGNAKQENKLESSCGIEKEDVQNSKESCNTSSNKGEATFGLSCMVDIFNFLCMLIRESEIYEGEDDDLLCFSLRLVNSIILFGRESLYYHVELLELIQDELFKNMLQRKLVANSVALSLVCNIVFNLYKYLSGSIKLQLEAFFSFVIIPFAKGKHNITFQHQEIAVQCLVDFCHHPNFMAEMYANFDCDIACNNIFEDLVNLLANIAFPINSPFSSLHTLALEGVLMTLDNFDSRIDTSMQFSGFLGLREYVSYWISTCRDYSDPQCWVEYVQYQKHLKHMLMIAVNHFNRDPQKGIEFLQGINLLPEHDDPSSVAAFLRYSKGINKKVLGDFLGETTEFHIQILSEYAKTFDFHNMRLDIALRYFLNNFWLTKAAHRILEVFSTMYHEHCPEILYEDVVLLSYAIVMLNTNLHSVNVKEKMTEHDFIINIQQSVSVPEEILKDIYEAIEANEIKSNSFERSMRLLEITGSHRQRESTPYIKCSCVPEETLKDIYQAIEANEIKTSSFERSIEVLEITGIHWQRRSNPYIECSSSYLDADMFILMACPTCAVLSAVFTSAGDVCVLQDCLDGFFMVANMSASYQLKDILDNLIHSLCHFTRLLDVVDPLAGEEFLISFGNDTKACMAAVTTFRIVGQFENSILNAWRSIIHCVIRLHKMGLLPVHDNDYSMQDNPLFGNCYTPTISSDVLLSQNANIISKVGRLFSLHEDGESTNQVYQLASQTIEACDIDNIFMNSDCLRLETLQQIVNSVIINVRQNFQGDEDAKVLCLNILIYITIKNEHRIFNIWPALSEYAESIIRDSTMSPLTIKKAALALLQIFELSLSHDTNLSDDRFQPLCNILHLCPDANIEQIGLAVLQFVKGSALHITSLKGWQVIAALLIELSRQRQGSQYGFEAIWFIIHDNKCVSVLNFIFCVEVIQAFLEAKNNSNKIALRALDLLSECTSCLSSWSRNLSNETTEMRKKLVDMWLRITHAVTKTCVERSEEKRNRAITILQDCFLSARYLPDLPSQVLGNCFCNVIFTLLDDLLEIPLNTSIDYPGIDFSLQLAIRLLYETFTLFSNKLSGLPSFESIWINVLDRMGLYMDRLIEGKEIIPELLIDILRNLSISKVFSKSNASEGSGLWDITWHHIHSLPSLNSELCKRLG